MRAESTTLSNESKWAEQLFRAKGYKDVQSVVSNYLGIFNEVKKELDRLVNESDLAEREQFDRSLQGATSLFCLWTIADAIIFQFKRNKVEEKVIRNFEGFQQNLIARCLAFHADNTVAKKASIKSDSSRLQLFSLTTDVQLANVGNEFYRFYLKDRKQPWRIILNAAKPALANDGAAVVFNFQAMVLGDSVQRQNIGQLSRTVINTIIDTLAFFLAEKVDAENVPNILRICIAVNFRTHWTTLIANVENYQRLYQKLHAYDTQHGLEFKLANEKLYVVREFLKDDSKAPVKNGAAKDVGYPFESLIGWLRDKTDLCFDFSCYDSSGSSEFAVRDSLHYLMNCFNGESNKSGDQQLRATLAEKDCAKQQGLTCGDHTNCNMFFIGLFSRVPAINNGAGVTSAHLRDLTLECSKHPRNQARVDELLNFIFDCLSQNNEQLTEMPQGLTNFLDHFVEQIYSINPEKAMFLLNILILGVSSIPQIEEFSLLQENINLVIALCKADKSSKNVSFLQQAFSLEIQFFELLTPLILEYLRFKQIEFDRKFQTSPAIGTSTAHIDDDMAEPMQQKIKLLNTVREIILKKMAGFPDGKWPCRAFESEEAVAFKNIEYKIPADISKILVFIKTVRDRKSHNTEADVQAAITIILNVASKKRSTTGLFPDTLPDTYQVYEDIKRILNQKKATNLALNF